MGLFAGRRVLKMKWIILYIFYFFCGLGFAKYSGMVILSTWSYHLWQWLPIYGGLILSIICGYWICDDKCKRNRSFFMSFIGIPVANIALACEGYVLGRLLFY
jgi:hypothetical protein